MAKIYNSDLSKELQAGAKIQINVDRVPDELAEKVVPVMEVNPKLLRRVTIMKRGLSTATGTITIYTTPADKDFYLTDFYISYFKDAACDNTSIIMTAAVDGASVELWGIRRPTLTADSDNISFNLNFPIKIDRNTTITLTGTFAVGVLQRQAGIFGYTDDVSKA